MASGTDIVQGLDLTPHQPEAECHPIDLPEQGLAASGLGEHHLNDVNGFFAGDCIGCFLAWLYGIFASNVVVNEMGWVDKSKEGIIGYETRKIYHRT